MTVTNSADTRRVFGTQVRNLRQELGLSQAELAARMTDAGHQMHQTTIAKIESGDRPTPLEEGTELSGILGVTLSDMLIQENERVQRARQRLVSLRSEATAYQRELSRALQQARDAQEALTVTRKTIKTAEATLKALEKVPSGKRR